LPLHHSLMSMPLFNSFFTLKTMFLLLLRSSQFLYGSVLSRAFSEEPVASNLHGNRGNANPSCYIYTIAGTTPCRFYYIFCSQPPTVASAGLQKAVHDWLPHPVYKHIHISCLHYDSCLKFPQKYNMFGTFVIYMIPLYCLRRVEKLHLTFTSTACGLVGIVLSQEAAVQQVST
jgi:hypothetical protein